MFIYRSLSLIVSFIFNFIGLVLMLRIGLKFFGANEAAPFVTWIYDTTEPLLNPFKNMFPSEKTPQGFLVEISSLFALLTYMFVAFFTQELLETFNDFFNRRDKKVVVEKVEKND